MDTSVDELAALKGQIFDVQRFSIHDGPGIRTTVFMKGCPLRCAWCHNPEGVSPKPVLSFIADRCINCGYCFKVCKQGAHQVVDGKHVLLRDRCIVCGECATECHSKALELVGRTATVGEIIDEVLRDKPFYETSGGGMTLSGGEPTMQIEFTEALLRTGKENDLHNAVETCGFCEWERIERILPLVDLFLFDYKATDPDLHKELTGVPNDRIMDNLRRLDESAARIFLRCPVVPGVNDQDEHFAAIRELARKYTSIRGVEIMPYHKLGEGKINRFGMNLKRVTPQPPSQELIDSWKKKLGDCLTPS